VRGDGDSAEKHREFYDEYLAVMDLTAEFYLQTVDTVFVRHMMARGLMTHRGRRIDLSRIRRVAIMTVEGEKDDITGLGQCRAAQDLCSGVPAGRKLHFECPEVGHYGIFNGSRFRREIASRIADFARQHDGRTARGIVAPPINRRGRERPKSAPVSEPEGAAFTFADKQSARPAPARIEPVAAAPAAEPVASLAVMTTAGVLALDIALKASGLKPL
jgi:poly(3-hydroxybutyrate) depolymerase